MWPQENPWPVVFLCLLATIGCLIAWAQAQRGQRNLLIGAAVCLLAALGALACDAAIETPRERLLESVTGITTAFQNGDRDGTLFFISNQAPELQGLVRAAMEVVKVEGPIRVTDVHADLHNEGTRGRTRFRANAQIVHKVLGSLHQPTLWEARWQLERGEWKMVEITQFDPITGEQLHQIDDIRSIPR